MEGKQKCFIDVSKPLISVQGTKTATAKAGEACQFMDKVSASVGDKASAMLQHGYTSFTCTQGWQDNDSMTITPAGGITSKDGNISLGMDFLGKMTSSAGKLRIENSWASKLTAKALSSLLSAVTFKGTIPGERTIEVLVCDGHADSNMVIYNLTVA